MEHLRRLRLLGKDGQPLSTRIDGVLNGLLQKFRRRFPSIQDEGDLTEVFEEAASRIDKREQRSGTIEKVNGYAWVTLRSIGLSWLRRGSSQLELRTVGSSQTVLSSLRAYAGSQEEIERDILLDELTAQLTADEHAVLLLKRAGYSSAEIASRRGCSTGAIDVLLTRVRQKIRRLAGIQE